MLSTSTAENKHLLGKMMTYAKGERGQEKSARLPRSCIETEIRTEAEEPSSHGKVGTRRTQRGARTGFKEQCDPLPDITTRETVDSPQWSLPVPFLSAFPLKKTHRRTSPRASPHVQCQLKYW